MLQKNRKREHTMFRSAIGRLVVGIGVIASGLVFVARADAVGVVTASQLNVRTEPTTNASIHKMLNRGDAVNIINMEGDWYKINIDGGEFYVSSNWVVISGQMSSRGDSETSVTPTTGDLILATAIKYLGVPYRYGGSSPRGFDCSGYVQYVVREAVGVSLPRTTYSQVKMGTSVSREEMRPGDIIFFKGLDHVGIYAGNNQYIHSPQTGRNVSIDPLNRVIHSIKRIG